MLQFIGIFVFSSDIRVQNFVQWLPLTLKLKKQHRLLLFFAFTEDFGLSFFLRLVIDLRSRKLPVSTCLTFMFSVRLLGKVSLFMQSNFDFSLRHKMQPLRKECLNAGQTYRFSMTHIQRYFTQWLHAVFQWKVKNCFA